MVSWPVGRELAYEQARRHTLPWHALGPLKKFRVVWPSGVFWWDDQLDTRQDRDFSWQLPERRRNPSSIE